MDYDEPLFFHVIQYAHRADGDGLGTTERDRDDGDGFRSGVRIETEQIETKRTETKRNVGSNGMIIIVRSLR